MQLYPLKLVTVVGETVIMQDIADRGLELGATGYTLSEVIGQGSRSTRNIGTGISSSSKTMKLEFVVPVEVAVEILTHISHEYFEHYAIIAWLSDVQVVRGQQYLKTGG